MTSKILVCGDTMRDRYLWGDIRRISPEAAVPVVRIEREESREGAAANVANNIEAMGVPCERIFGGGERIEKIRVIARGHHFARLDYDYPQKAIEPDDLFSEACDRCGIVVMLDYGKGSLSRIQELIAVALAKECKIFVDPKGHDYAKYRGVTMIKPNHEEMRELVGGWSSQAELDFKARQFLASSGIESILLTQAAEGMTLYTLSSTEHFRAEAKEVVDVSGAGETAIAAYAAAIAKGAPSGDAARLANRAAGLACAKFGTTVITGEAVFGTD